MASTSSARNRVFISYSHSDRKYLDRLKTHLVPYERRGLLSVWDDTQIRPGSIWYEEIKQAIKQTKVAILLVSADFLASRFIAEDELPPLLDAAKSEGAIIIPIILSHCAFEQTELAKFQAINSPSRPLDMMRKSEREEIWARVARIVNESMNAQQTQPPQAPPLQIPSQPIPQTSRPPLQSHRPSTGSGPTSPSNTLGNISRRKVILLGAGGLVGGGLIWLLASRVFLSTSSTNSTPPRHSTPTPIPLGKHLYTYYGHSKIVYAVAWSPDSRRVASGDRNATVQVWNAAGEGNPYIYTNHSDIVETVAWSPDGTRIASGSQDTTVQVWNASDGGNIFKYTYHSALVRSVAWSHDGTRIASASYDGTVQVWNHNSNYPLTTYLGHHGNVNSVSWSPDDKYIVSGGDDTTVQIWDASSGNTLHTCHGHTQTVYAVAWSRDGKYIASGSWDNTVIVWDASGGTALHTCTGHTDKIWTVTWSPDSTRIASGGQDHTVRVWNASNASSLITYRGHMQDVNAVAWSPDGTRIASGSGGKDGNPDNTVQIWGAG